MVICESCECDVLETHLIEAYHPFNTEPYYSGHLCDSCIIDGFYFCETCERHVSESNGYRRNIRINEYGEVCCVKCLQDNWFENGMPNFQDADFFDDNDLENKGYSKHSHYYCKSLDSYKEVEIIFKALQTKGLVIVSIEASGMGLEHHISLWTKKQGEKAISILYRCV